MSVVLCLISILVSTCTSQRHGQRTRLPTTNGRNQTPKPFSTLTTPNARSVIYAMLYWLTSDKAKKGIWGEISKLY